MTATDIGALINELRSLASQRPSEERRRRLESGLLSKWDGVRVVAAQALCSWGDEASIASVRAALCSLAVEPVRWSSVGAIAKALAPKLAQADVEWCLDLFVRQSHRDNRFVLTVLFEYINAQYLLRRLNAAAAEATDPRLQRELKGAIARATWRAQNEA
jgi:hypothetical protein